MDESQTIESVLPDAPLAQGDVMFWPDATESLYKSGVIVTGDCDLALEKHWGRISVVPVVALSSYVEELLAPKILARYGPKLREVFGNRVSRALRAAGDTSPGTEALEQLIGAELLPPSLDSHSQVRELHQILRQSYRLHSYTPNLACLESALRILSPSGKNALQNSVRSQLSSFPGDVLPLPRIEGLPFDVAVAWLRVLREVRESEIARKMSELSAGRAIRIARLSPVVRYRLTQMLAHVFSDIGLPEHHERSVREQIDGYISTLP